MTNIKSTFWNKSHKSHPGLLGSPGFLRLEASIIVYRIKKEASLRTSAHRVVAIPWIFSAVFDGFPSIRGIATSPSAPRNDSVSLCKQQFICRYGKKCRKRN